MHKTVKEIKFIVNSFSRNYVTIIIQNKIFFLNQNNQNMSMFTKNTIRIIYLFKF